jgi:cellulose synthase/poly-beta-1,6-N-acetylglucosamine synthase-like glycosyltransferase
MTTTAAPAPTVSVVIPAYNAAATITRALGSVFGQTVPATEIIVVDDGSTDATAAVVGEFAPAVTLIQQPNGGVGAARNRGVEAARGEWIAFLDADDAWRPAKLERQLRETGDVPRLGLLGCRAMRKDGTPVPTELGFDDLWERNDLITSAVLVRRRAIEELGGFWVGRSCEDYHFWLRLAAAGWTIRNVPEELVAYTPAAESLSQRIESFTAAEIACLRDIAARVRMPAWRLRRRLRSAGITHCLAAVHARDLALARRFALRLLRHGPTPASLRAVLVAFTPRMLLDARRGLINAGHRDGWQRGLQLLGLAFRRSR